MNISIACDHGAVELKARVAAHLKEQGHHVVDFGTHTADSCDYPDIIAPAAQAVARGECQRGIVMCTTGIGVSIVANKVPGIRCALLHDLKSAEMTRLHNDTNMMALGGSTVSEDLALQIVDIWLSTPFSGEERHCRRLQKIAALESL